ncbi:EAL and GGDEF domain-containing protein [Nitrincola nitratireducens]|uniref:Cyclic di-GMP phosphodiesterase Gmr n=1 Tax=Nitrincola nitratireducens TaxID=1229521 RepID=W9UWD7_9GAMM|nr:bifunctional diguanylate cyclase/phosphodiesterase [Nitrincola nitratireducens]EXJ09046.1 Cyclic di-GMP phosphodiesterase Gmr [Nitrincola nitratireducens]
MKRMSDANKISFLEFLLHSNTDPIIVKNWQGKFVFANQAVANLYGTTPEKMIGFADEDFTGNLEQGQFFLENVQRIMKAFKPELVYEDSTDANTGEVRHFVSHKIPFINPLNELNILVIAKDVTDITRLKINAEYNEKRLNYVLETTKEGVWDWNLVTNEVYHNTFWYQLTGLNEDRCAFEDFKNCIHPEDRHTVMQCLTECIENNKPYRVVFRLQHVNGSLIWVFDRGEIVQRDTEGRPTRMIGAIQDITQQKLDQAQIEKLAFYDPLTELPNRRLLQEHIELAIHYNHKTQTTSALLFLDLDNFKMLNDTHGHNLGDQLLIEVSKRLQTLVGDQHTVARFGGDEFVLIINELDFNQSVAYQQAILWSEKLHACFSESIPLNLNKLSTQHLTRIEYQITVSIGITLFNGEDHYEVDDLLKLADLALYRAKTDGRNRTVVFDPRMQEDLMQSQKMLQAFTHAIKNNEFELFYQPQYNKDHQVIGVEALIRWQKGKDLAGVEHYLSPIDFIPVAEETGLIIPLGDWVIEQACAQLAQWQQDPAFENLVVSVNISAKQLAQADFSDKLLAAVSAYKINSRQLKLEITESCLLQNVSDLINKLLKIKEYGFKISLDDFGTGYSSLSYLKRLPVDEIKIDRSFVRDIMTDESDAIMVKAIIDLSRNFGLEVIAEGVETSEQLDRLIEFGCAFFQGYYFNKPLKLSELNNLILT